MKNFKMNFKKMLKKSTRFMLAGCLTASMVLQTLQTGFAMESDSQNDDRLLSKSDTQSEYSFVGESGTQNGYRLLNENIKDLKSESLMESAEVLSTSSVQSTESKVMALSSDIVSFDDFYLECRQIANEKRNGIYFINHDSIVFYNWGTYPFRVRYDYKNIYNTFLSGTDLYVLSEDSTDATKMQYTVIDLNNGALVKEKKGLSGSTSAIGVDATGRIFLADAEYMHVLDANGNTLSKTAITDSIYDIVYIDLKTNTIYFTGYANWVYWGYDHDMCVVKTGTISGNTVTLEEKVIVEFLNQLYFYDRKHPIEVLNDEYFYEESVYYGGSFLSEIKDYPESVLLGFKQTYNNEFEASGTRGVYWAKKDALISYVGNNTVKAVGIESGMELYSITSKYPVFSMMLMGETLLLVEKENDQFYLEEIALKESSKLQINGAKDIKVKESVQLSVTSDGNLKDELSWSSSDSTVASVDSNGKVFGWHPGTATITVKNSNGISAQCKINVTKQASEVTKKTIVSLPASDHYNKDFNDYYMWSSPMESFLMENGDGSFSRIEFYDGYVLIDTFSESGSKKSTKKIKAELPIFGGFFAGETYNFLVYGKKNENETDSTEVMRVVKYSKDWTRLGYGSVYGANTYIPFEAGCLRMDEKDGVLYIHTCHEMYQSEDGYHHQANMTYEFDQKTMKEKQSWYDVMNISYGYVSHSFNQFIKVDDSYVYRVDHGDAYPRGVALTRYKIGDDLTNVEYTTLEPFPGMTGYNLTGASIGGFELSDDNCLIVGSSVPFNENASTYDIQNVFLWVMKKDFSDGNLIRLTNYTSDSDPIVGTPQIVKFSDGGYLIMWKEEKKVVTSNGVDYTTSVKAVTVDSEGNLTSKIQNTKLVLSDCQPIVDKYGLVCWYVNDWTSSKLYRIDSLNISSDLIEKEVLSAPKLNSVANSASGITVKWNKVTGADFYRVYRKTSGGSWTKVVDTKDGNVTSYTDTKAAAGTTYTYTVKAFKDGVGGYYDKTGKTICRLTQPKLTSAANGASGITVKWEKVAGATGYYVYRKSGTGSWSRIGTTTSNGTVSFADKTAVAGTTYTYTVRAYKGSVLSSFSTTGISVCRLTQPKLASIANGNSGIIVKWEKVAGATGYYVYRKSGTGSWSKIGTTTSNGAVSFTDKTAVAGTTYTYTVRAYTGSVLSSFDKTGISMKRLTQPAVPKLAKATDGIKITFTKVTGADGYYVYRKEGTGSWKRIASTASLSVTDTTAVAGHTYVYTVRAWSKVGSTTVLSSYNTTGSKITR